MYSENVLVIYMCFAFINFYSGREHIYISWDESHVKLYATIVA